jgi:hypothetical protein
MPRFVSSDFVGETTGEKYVWADFDPMSKVQRKAQAEEQQCRRQKGSLPEV